MIVWIHDNRSASGRGVESQWPVYGNLGEPELRDLEDGIAWLKQQPGVDASRILLSGWSYGGFMTAYALTHSTSWAGGIVGAPVTDWRDYDTVYTERLMKMPQNNPDGYRKSAPRFAADKLHGRMLLMHGTTDDNVHFQNTVQFVYELQRAGKSFEMMVYPRSRHAVDRSAAQQAPAAEHVRLHDEDGRRASRAQPERQRHSRRMSLLDALRTGSTVIAAELRPPRAELDSAEGMDAWIDMYHAIRGLARQDVRVFLTDSAVGTQEENNLRHLVTNLGRDVPRERVVPFLTSKHSLEFCLTYAEQAWQHGFSSLVVLGGDKTVGRPRCVEHAWELRRAIRDREPRLALGGWANPYADAARAGRLPRRRGLHGGVLPDADRQPSERRAGRAVPRRDAAARRRRGARDVRRLLLPQRQREDAAAAEPVPAGARGGARRPSSPPVRHPSTSAPERCAR